MPPGFIRHICELQMNPGRALGNHTALDAAYFLNVDHDRSTFGNGRVRIVGSEQQSSGRTVDDISFQDTAAAFQRSGQFDGDSMLD